MLSTEMQRDLDEALDRFVFTDNLAEIGPRRCAENFFDAHPKLMQQVQKPWAVERLTNLIKHRNQRGWPSGTESQQFVLPGFENLPRRIFLPNGTRKPLDSATVGQIREHLHMLRRRFSEHPKIKRVEAILALMLKYSKDQPRITWLEVKKKEIESMQAR